MVTMATILGSGCDQVATGAHGDREGTDETEDNTTGQRCQESEGED